MTKIKLSGENLTEHFTFKDYGKNQTGTIPIDAAALLHAQLLEEFRQWLGRPMEVHAWYRTAAYNKKVGGVSTSSHLKGTATDWSTNIEISKEKFIKYAAKWKEICAAHGVVGEGACISAQASPIQKDFTTGTAEAGHRSICRLRS